MSAELGSNAYEDWHDTVKDEVNHRYASVNVDYNTKTAQLEIVLTRNTQSRKNFLIALGDDAQRKLYEYLKKYVEE